MTNHSFPSSLSMRLANLSYEDSAHEFVRFHDDPNDELVASVVRAVTLESEVERENFRTDLDESATDTLRLYAQRRTLQARRRASINLVDEAIEGFALLLKLNDVPWDSWLKATLFVADSLGREVNELAQKFSELALPASTSRFTIAFESMNRVTSLADCRIAEVTTTYGTGFVETLVFQDSSSSGFVTGFTPRRPDDYVIFRPLTNVAQLAVSFAAGLDATDTLTTSHIVQDQVAAMPFDLKIAGSFLPTSGCLSFFADSTNGGVSFKAFVAELNEDFDLNDLALADTTDGQAVFIDDGRLILLLANPSFDDVDENEFEPSDFANIAHSAFTNTAPARWTAL
jgi:hypothetical protein